MKILITTFRFLVVLMHTGCDAYVISMKDFQSHSDNPSLMDGEYYFSKMLDVASSVKIEASIHTTSKGNGYLHFGNLTLHIFDRHDDGVIYENGGLLNVEFVDIDGDLCLDVVVSGILSLTDEESGECVSREPIVFFYRFNSAEGKYDLAYRSAPFDLEDGSSYAIE